MTVDDSQLLPAGVWRRFAAMVYDGFLLFAALFVATLIPELIINADNLGTTPSNDSVIHQIDHPMQGVLYQLYLLSVIVVFYGYFWRKSGQTLGMQAWRLRLRDRNGGPPSWGQCLVRIAVGSLSLLLGGMGYFWVWIDKDGRAWHDIASRTRLDRLPKD